MASQFEKELLDAIRADPFVPFNVVLAGGIRYLVSSPDSLVIRDSVIDHYAHGSDQQNLLRMNQLAAIEFLKDL